MTRSRFAVCFLLFVSTLCGGIILGLADRKIDARKRDSLARVGKAQAIPDPGPLSDVTWAVEPRFRFLVPTEGKEIPSKKEEGEGASFIIGQDGIARIGSSIEPIIVDSIAAYMQAAVDGLKKDKDVLSCRIVSRKADSMTFDVSYKETSSVVVRQTITCFKQGPRVASLHFARLSPESPKALPADPEAEKAYETACLSFEWLKD